MHVNVEHGLPGLGAVVKNNPKIIADIIPGRQFGPDPHHFTDKGVILSGYRCRATDMFFGDYQKMHRGLGADIAKGQQFIIFEYFFSRYFTLDYFTE
jgi:hypothetical protein